MCSIQGRLCSCSLSTDSSDILLDGLQHIFLNWELEDLGQQCNGVVVVEELCLLRLFVSVEREGEWVVDPSSGSKWLACARMYVYRCSQTLLVR